MKAIVKFDLTKIYRNIFQYILAVFLLLSINSCEDDLINDQSGSRPNSTTPSQNEVQAITDQTVDDIDGNTYNTVQLGEHAWLASNLRTTRYPNGDAIPQVISSSEWALLSDDNSSGAYCVVGNNTDNAINYGNLYTYAAAIGLDNNISEDVVQGICPDGWHIPDDEEWQALESYLGISDSELSIIGWRGVNQGSMLKNASDWSLGLERQDTLNFNAFISGYRSSSNGKYYGVGDDHCTWWTTTPAENGFAYHRCLSKSSKIYRGTNHKSLGASVRCVQDDIPPFTVVKDTVVSVFSDMAVLNVEITYDEESPLIELGVEYSTTPEFTAPARVVVEIDGLGEFSVELNDLMKSTKYYYRIFFTNTEGTSYGDVSSFTTSIFGSVIDIDGNLYKTITIGDQEWMAENLKVTKYPNGVAIPFIADNMNWANLIEGGFPDAYCSYENSADSAAKYGQLYTYAAANAKYWIHDNADNQGICPDGWHLPSDKDWVKLEDYLADNGYNYDGTFGGGEEKIGKSLASTIGWNITTEIGSVGNDLASNNASGFTALPGGLCDEYGYFMSVGNNGRWWTKSDASSYSAGSRNLDYVGPNMASYNGGKFEGLSIRCIKGVAISTPYLTTDSIRDVTSNSVVVYGNVVSAGGLTITSRGVEYSTDFRFANSTTIEAGAADMGVFNVSIPSLESSTLYYCRTYATNTEGTSYGSEDSFYTEIDNGINYGSVTDFDGNVYKTVTIGTQEWMAENLRVINYPNGEPITNITDNTVWNNLADDNLSEAYCILDNNADNALKYGCLYTYAAASAVNWEYGNAETQGVCPDGWRLPTNEDWSTLTEFVGSNGHDAGEGLALKSVSDWNYFIDIYNTDDYGFAALPAGSRSGGIFQPAGPTGLFWTGTELSAGQSYYIGLDYSSPTVMVDALSKSLGASVRCVK